MHFGISTALLTPFHANGAINLPLFCKHANNLLQNGVNGVTLFGTTGEGASIGLDDRGEAIAAMVESGVAADVMTIGLCATAITDVISQIHQGVTHGVTQFLLLPPFYFKNLDDAGVFEWHSQLFELADARAKFILYHIPQVTHVPLSFDLVTRLGKSYPDRVLAIKDSAGNWDSTRNLLENSNIPILVGDERLLHKAAVKGAAGSICGMANLFPQRMRTLFESQTEDTAISSQVDLIVSYPVTPALKLAMVVKTGDESWGHVRAPLTALTGEARAAVAAGFSEH